MRIDVLELGRAIKQLQNRNHRRLEVAFRTIDTTLAQWDALRAIDSFPGASAHALAEETFQTDQSLGTLANRLIAKGLIEREQGVGRSLAHHLTPKGRDVLAQAMAIAAEVMRDAFKEVPEAERGELLRLVNKALL